MLGLLHRSILVLLTITMAACTTVGDPPGAGGSGGAAGTGGTAGTAGAGGSSGAGGSGGVGGSSGTGGVGGSGMTAPKVSLTASPSNVASGAEAELVWEVTDSESCSATDGWGGLRDAGGGSEVRPIYGDKRFVLTCIGPGGEAESAEATVDLSTSQLQVTINMNYYLVLPGQTFNVNVTVANPGAVMVPGVIVNLLVPLYVIINKNDLPSETTCIDLDNDDICDAGEEIAFDVGDLGGGEATDRSVTPEVEEGIPEGQPLEFRARVTDDSLRETSFVEMAEEGESDLALALGQSPSQPQAGGVLVYSLAYGNTGSELLEDVLLTLTLPNHTTLAGMPSGGVVGDGTVIWSIGDLIIGETGTVEAVVDVDPLLPEGVPLRARADAVYTKDGEEVRTRTTSQAQLGTSSIVVMSANLTPTRVGSTDRMDLAVTLSNPGVDPLTELEVRVVIPEGIAWFYTNKLTAGAICPPSNTSCYAGETAIWSGLSLRGGESKTLWANYLNPSTADAGSVIPFAASVLQGGELLAEALATALKEERVLDLRLSETATPIAPGGEIIYVLDFANQSASTIFGGAVTLRIPPGTILDRASDGGNVNSDGAVEWPLDGLKPEEGGARYAVVQIDGLAIEGSQLSASATGIVGGEHVASATTSATLKNSPLVATVQVGPDRVRPGERTEVEVTVKNVSDDPISEIEIGLRMPQGVQWFYTDRLSTGGLPSRAVCPPSNTSCYAGETAFWRGLSLDGGDSVTVTGVPYMESGTEGLLASFDARVTAADGTSVLATATTRVDAAPAMELQLVESAHPVSLGARLTYTLHFVNRSSVTRDGVVTLTIPAGTTFVSATDERQPVDGVVEWPFEQLGPGEGGVLQLVVDVNQNTDPLPTLLRADATGVVDNDVRIARATANTPTGNRSLVGRVELSPDPVTENERVDVAVTVSNPSSDPVTEVDVRLRLPQGIDWFYTTELSQSGRCPPSDTSCYGGETVIWDDLSLDAYESVTLTLAPIAPNGSVDTLMPFSLEVAATDQQTLIGGATVLVDNRRELEIRLDEDAHPVYPGGLLTYTLHYGNPTSRTVKQRMTLAIPESTRFIGASDAGDDNGQGVVEWDAIDVPAGKGGTLEVTVALIANENPPASQLRAAAEVIIIESGADSAGRRTRATAQTPVGETPLVTPLELSIAAPPFAAEDEQVAVDVVVTNTGADPVNDISVRVRLPQYLDWFYANVLSHPATCPSSNTSCYSGEQVIFDAISLAAGESITFTIPPIIASGAPDGTLVTFLAQAVIAGGPSPSPHAAGTLRVCSGSGCQ